MLAGGLATRMRPLTETVPKSMLAVAGEPFIAHQLRLFHRQGLTRVVLCLGHLGDAVRDSVGDGSAFGLSVSSSFDGGVLLGTAGALKKAAPMLGDVFWVTYGDSYLDVDLAPIWQAFERSERPALMTVLRNENRWDRSNVHFRDGRIECYDKHDPSPVMNHVDFGLSLFRRQVLDDVPGGQPSDLATVLSALVRRGAVAGFEVSERFFEIGSPQGLRETDHKLRQLRQDH
ncbi:nucleotidyltransferase family protein [Mycolicibacterium sp. P1-18]|uniref:nucleotidyltransferase family protein n=1 Tax=Mycolicibacterium sp. P1-18 TaxID=2024615 RepID=UPI0021028686|nr:nucleotidyltransferase family protein [Mycolicibacterium sp. P1-18]